MSDIIVCKLVTGEEIIAKLIERKQEDTGEVLKLGDVIRIGIAGQDREGKVQIGFAPWLAVDLDCGEVEIKESAVICYPKVHDELANAYIQQTTGIQIAGPGDLK